MRKRSERATASRAIGCAVVVALSLWASSSTATAFELRSPAFAAGADIPASHTCDGKDVSPPLRWSDPPASSKSFALIVDDPDAPRGTWVHWVLYAIPASARDLPPAVPGQDTVAGAGVQGVNDFRTIGYGGPCPPPGPAHRYVFKLYALDTPLGLPAGKSKAEVLQAIEGHVLAQAELTARYRRR